MRKKNLYIFVMLLTGLLLLNSSAWAAVWQLDATSKVSWISDFTVIFNDIDNDNEIELSPIEPPALMSPEILDFSGVSIKLFCLGWFDFDILYEIPNLIVDGLTLIGPDHQWHFRKSPNGGTGTLGISGTHTYAATHSPIPGAVWLFGSGIIGIVGIRRKFKK